MCCHFVSPSSHSLSARQSPKLTQAARMEEAELQQGQRNVATNRIELNLSAWLGLLYCLRERLALNQQLVERNR